MNTTDTLIYVGGSKQSFQCEDCGCNVFTKLDAGKFECNSCGARYLGEVK